MKKPRFRSLQLKSYFGQGNGIISFNQREEEEGVNQQSQQQRYNDEFSEHAYFFNFTQVCLLR